MTRQLGEEVLVQRRKERRLSTVDGRYEEVDRSDLCDPFEVGQDLFNGAESMFYTVTRKDDEGVWARSVRLSGRVHWDDGEGDGR